MAKQVIKGKNFDSSLISISDKPSIMDSGAKYVWVGYKSKNLIVQTPTMEVPFGLNIYDKGEYPKYSVELSFRGMDVDKSLSRFHDNLKSFDEKLIDEGVKNSMAWFKKKTANRDVISAMFNPQVKVPTDKETGEELSQYPNRIRLKIPVRDGNHECELVDKEGNKIEKELSNVFVRGTRVKAIIQCVGLWISSGNYNCQWKLVRAEVDIPEGEGDLDFLPDTDDEGETNTINSNKIVKDEVEDEEDEEDEEDDDEEEDDDDEEESEPELEPEPVKPMKGRGSKGKLSKK